MVSDSAAQGREEKVWQCIIDERNQESDNRKIWLAGQLPANAALESNLKAARHGFLARPMSRKGLGKNVEMESPGFGHKLDIARRPGVCLQHFVFRSPACA